MLTPATLAFYRTMIGFTRKLKFAGIPIAVMGFGIGLTFDGKTRTVTWVVSGLVAVWFTVQYSLMQRHYQRIVDAHEQAQT